MKKYLLFVGYTFLFSVASFTQLELHYNGIAAPESLNIDSTDLNSMIMTKYISDTLYVVNSSDQPIQLEYNRIRRYHKYGWDDQICDKLICFTCDDANSWSRPTDAASANQIVLAAGDSSVLIPKVFPRTIAGCAIYTYQITSPFGFIYDTIQISYTLATSNCFLSTETVENEIQYDVFPNPVNDILNINIKESNTVSGITIYNLVGKEVSSIILKNGNNQLDLSKLSSGVYFYAIKSNHGIIETKKLILQ